MPKAAKTPPSAGNHAMIDNEGDDWIGSEVFR